jgi:hypothetical protein
MGQAKMRQRWIEELTPYARDGQILALHGSPLSGKSPEVLAKVAAGHHDVEGLLAELRSGRLVHLTGNKFSAPASVEDWLASKAGLGPELLQALMLAHNDVNRGSKIYPMQFSDPLAVEMDRLFFVENKDRQLRIRPLLGGERQIGELNPGWTDRVVVMLLDLEGGMRSRYFFGCSEDSPDARLDLTDREIAALARRYANIG